MGELISLQLRRDRRTALQKHKAEVRRAELPLGWVGEVVRMDAHLSHRASGTPDTIPLELRQGFISCPEASNAHVTFSGS